MERSDVEHLVNHLKSKGDLVEALYELSGSYEYRVLQPLLFFLFEETKKLKERHDRPVINNIKKYVDNFYTNDECSVKFSKHVLNQIAAELTNA